MFFKQFFAALLFAGASAEKVSMTKDETKSVVEGILNGAVGVTDFSSLDTCIPNF